METLEQLENAYFILEMQDSEDYRYANELKEKIKKLKGEKQC